MNIEITTPKGEVKSIIINQFPALDGWDIQQRYVEFAASHDKELRKAYTLEVLGYAAVVMAADRSIPLTTSAMIDNHLCSWQNVQKVFEEVLWQNGIDPATHADNPTYWSKAGAEMATSFLAEVSQLMGPAFQLMNKDG
jgi:hypothetical protein